MPGRRSTGPPTTAPLKKKKRTAKRSLNALAIAEQQHPARPQLRENRLGVPEQEYQGQKRPLDDEGSNEDTAARSQKRRRAGDKDRYGNEIEGGSDSDGNEWVLGQINSEDDSDLDSDAAMGESDEEKFEGFTFRGSSSTGTRSRPQENSEGQQQNRERLQAIDLDENVADLSNSKDDSDGLGEDAIDLADALDDVDDGSTGTESDPESSQNDFGFSDTSDHEDTTDPKKIAFIGDMISNLNSSEQALPAGHTPYDKALESTTPSEFGLRSSQKLTVADLQASITDPNLRKSLKLLASDTSKISGQRNGISRKLEVPLAKRQQDRLDRSAAYEKSKETLNRWIDTVKYNRRAEHLSFPLKDPSAAATQGTHRMAPTTHSKPVTELEGVIQDILQASGLGPTQSKSDEDQVDEFTDLPSNNISLEEVQARRAELRRARDLLFREEKRAKRIKKIKSKSYRKVHRKDREKSALRERDAMAAAGVDDSEEEQAKNDRRRAEERMGQRHRESHWAKSIKDSGRAAWDEDARNGVTEMARRGEELRRRIEGKTVESNGNDEDASSESEFSNLDGTDREEQEGSNDDLLHRLRGNSGEKANDGPGNKSTLSSMAFMQRASSFRRTQNDAEAEKIRRELNNEESLSEEEPSEATGRRSYGPSTNKIESLEFAPQPEQKSEFEERRASDEEDENEIRLPDAEEEQFEILIDAADNARISKPRGKPSTSRTHYQNSVSATKDPSNKHADNPWLSTTPKSKRNPRKESPSAVAIITNTIPPLSKPISALKGSRASAIVSADTTKSQTPSTSRSVGVDDAIPDHTSGSEEEKSTSNPLHLRNRSLVARAFAGDAVVASFEAEKASIASSEAPRTLDTTLPGWGTWVGTGLTKSQSARNSNRFSTTLPGIEKGKRQDAKLEKVIINEKQMKKNRKYLASALPHPFETRAQYERSLRLPVGPEWSTKETFQGMTKPRVMVKQGVVEAMKRPMI